MTRNDRIGRRNAERAWPANEKSLSNIRSNRGSLDPPPPLHLLISKGVSGKCSRRGGYFKCMNVSDEVHVLIYKMVSIGLYPPLSSQIGVDRLVRPPNCGCN